jgi:hypothetical protein
MLNHISSAYFHANPISKKKKDQKTFSSSSEFDVLASSEKEEDSADVLIFSKMSPEKNCIPLRTELEYLSPEFIKTYKELCQIRKIGYEDRRRFVLLTFQTMKTLTLQFQSILQ